MTEPNEKGERSHAYLFDPPIEGKPPRSEQLDELLCTVRAGKLGGRAILWLAGFIAAVGAIWQNLGGFLK